MIAVIIPVYKAHDTILGTLYSVFMQRLVDYNVYLIVDGEEQGSYDYLHEMFALNIYYLPDNAGPGVARQFGIDNTDEEFISFIDSDDTYLTALSLYYQHKPFEDNIAMVSCNFLEEKEDHTLYLRENDMVWMHGKMYRREFLDKYDIRFNDTRANEDVGFNTQCQCYANKDEQIYISKDLAYLWQWRADSVVRNNDKEYNYNQSIEGYVVNKIYAFKKVIKQQGLTDPVKFFIMRGQAHLFKKYLMVMLKAPKQLRHAKKWARKYYRTLYVKYIDEEYMQQAEPSIVEMAGFKQDGDLEEFRKFKKSLEKKTRK